MRSCELVSHIGGGKQSRYYVDGKRVSKLTFYMLRDDAMRLECFNTSAIQTGTTFRRVNRETAVFED